MRREVVAQEEDHLGRVVGQFARHVGDDVFLNPIWAESPRFNRAMNPQNLGLCPRKRNGNAPRNIIGDAEDATHALVDGVRGGRIALTYEVIVLDVNGEQYLRVQVGHRIFSPRPLAEPSGHWLD